MHIVSCLPVLQFSDTKSPSVSKDLSSFRKRKHRLAIIVLFHLVDLRPLCLLSCWHAHEARTLIYGWRCPCRLTSITGRRALLASSQPFPGFSVVKSQQRRTWSLKPIAHLRSCEKTGQDALDTRALPSAVFTRSRIHPRAADLSSKSIRCPARSVVWRRGLCLRTLKCALFFQSRSFWSPFACSF